MHDLILLFNYRIVLVNIYYKLRKFIDNKKYFYFNKFADNH